MNQDANQDAAPPRDEVPHDVADGAPVAGAGAGAGAALLNVHERPDNHRLHDDEVVQALAAAFQQSLDDDAANDESDAWNTDDDDVLDDIQWSRGLANNQVGNMQLLAPSGYYSHEWCSSNVCTSSDV